jgi:hypothetical protein
MVATTQGKEFALKALAERREASKNLPYIDNASLPAGSPMYFKCIGCGARLVVGEGYITRPKFCVECSALVAIGWME